MDGTRCLWHLWSWCTRRRDGECRNGAPTKIDFRFMNTLSHVHTLLAYCGEKSRSQIGNNWELWYTLKPIKLLTSNLLTFDLRCHHAPWRYCVVNITFTMAIRSVCPNDSVNLGSVRCNHFPTILSKNPRMDDTLNFKIWLWGFDWEHQGDKSFQPVLFFTFETICRRTIENKTSGIGGSCVNPYV